MLRPLFPTLSTSWPVGLPLLQLTANLWQTQAAKLGNNYCIDGCSRHKLVPFPRRPLSVLLVSASALVWFLFIRKGNQQNFHFVSLCTRTVSEGQTRGNVARNGRKLGGFSHSTGWRQAPQGLQGPRRCPLCSNLVPVCGFN